MTPSVVTRPIVPSDRVAWEPLWAGYNAFYGRSGPTALTPTVADVLWQRFGDPDEHVFGIVAEVAGELVGLAHYLFHRSTTRVEPTCYLQDLFTAPDHRGRGIGRRLIEAVYDAARATGATRVYWQTQASNAPGRALYDRVARHAGFIVYTAEL